MRRRTDAGTGKSVLAGIVLNKLHQFGQCLGGNLWIDDHDVRRDRNQRHGRKILHRVVRHLGVETGVHDEAGADHHDGVAVRGDARDLAGRGVAAGAAHILDVELLAKIVGEFLSNDTRNGVGRSARGESDDHPHRLAGIALPG